MKQKEFAAILMFILCLSAIMANPRSVLAYMETGLIVYVNPHSNSARVNHIFSINISIANVPEPGLWAYEFKLYYNNSLLEPLSATIPAGHFLEPKLSPSNVLIVDPGTIEQTKGTVSFATSLINPEMGKTGSGILANITFAVIAPGECILKIGSYVADETKFIDGNGEPFTHYSIVDGNFEGIPLPPPPIPPPTPKGGWETIAFDFLGIYGYLTFPEECHANDTLTHELILAAEPDGIHVINLGINISCNTSSGEMILYTEKIFQNEDLPEDWSINKSITLTLPSGAYGKLNCVIGVDTYRQFTTCNGALGCYTTQIRIMTYEELLAKYELLLNQSNTTVEELNYWLAEYQELNTTYLDLLAKHDSLNPSYQELEANYNSLKSAYESLEANYSYLNSSYTSLKNDYMSLQAEYNKLLDAFNSLNSTYVELLWNYTSLVSDFELLQSRLSSLQTSYDDLSSTYYSLNSTYHALLDDYKRLESANAATTNEPRNAKIAWGILSVMTIVGTASTIYLLIRSLSRKKLKT